MSDSGKSAKPPPPPQPVEEEEEEGPFNLSSPPHLPIATHPNPPPPPPFPKQTQKSQLHYSLIHQKIVTQFSAI